MIKDTFKTYYKSYKLLTLNLSSKNQNHNKNNQKQTTKAIRTPPCLYGLKLGSICTETRQEVIVSIYCDKDLKMLKSAFFNKLGHRMVPLKET